MGADNHHDILVIGASAGGVRAVRALLAGLPADLGAAVFVVIHMDPTHESHLAELLSTPGGLPARTALDGDAIRQGQVLVAPSDQHLLVRDGHVEVIHGPRENGHRPAVDALFRTASTAYGPRVIGVVLTGNMDCGTAGLLSIKSRGGLAVVQNPAEAAAPSMPSSAIAHVQVDHVVPLADMAALLVRLVKTKAARWPADIRREVKEMEGTKLGDADVELVCPSCHGKLTVAHVDGYFLFRCHVGHVFSLQSLTAAQAEEVESALWASVRALEEAAGLSERVARTLTGSIRERMLERHRTLHAQAEVVRALVLGGRSLSPTDAEAMARPVALQDDDADVEHRRRPNGRGQARGARQRRNDAIRPANENGRKSGAEKTGSKTGKKIARKNRH